ncbi:MAG: hypothetical protein ACLPX5_13220 [Dissulfurispiraceae bacterium]
MRRGLLLQRRDKECLKLVATGPTPAKYICRRIFKKENANPKTRERLGTRRLNKLEADGLIECKTHPVFKYKLYTLTKKAATIVAAEYGLDRSHIWVNFNPQNIEHDLYVSMSAKKVIRGAEELQKYELTYLGLECGNRSVQKVQRGVYFPDFDVCIKGPSMSNKFDFEIDCGNMSRRDFLGKVGYFKNTIGVITKTWERLELLLWYLRADSVSKGVYVTTVNQFLTKTLFDCQWKTNLTDELVRLPLR